MSRIVRFLALWVLVIVGICAIDAAFTVLFDYAIDHPAQAPYMGAVILIGAGGISAWLLTSP